MLSIINPANMAMNMPCCSYAPYCSHSQRQVHSQTLPSFDLSAPSEPPSWTSRTSSAHGLQFDPSRSLQVPLFLRQASSYNETRIPQVTNTYSALGQPTAWAGPDRSILNDDFGNNWLSEPGRNSFHGSISSSFPHEPYGYISNANIDAFEAREDSPSRGTEFSAVSTSSTSSPMPETSSNYYDSTRLRRNSEACLPSQPKTLQKASRRGRKSSRTSSPSINSDGVSKQSRSRRGCGGTIHCNVCHKTFDRRSNFNSHRETHDKDRQRTVCKIDGCEKTFGRPAEMTRHVNSAHRQKSFPCASCGKEYTRHDILLRHCKDACPILSRGKPTQKGGTKTSE